MSGSITPPPSLGPAVITNFGGPFISGSAIPGAAITIYNSSGAIAQPPTTANSNGIFQNFYFLPTQGEYSFYATQQPSGGAVSQASAPLDILYIGSESPPNADIQTGYSTRDFATLFPQGVSFAISGNVNYVSLVDGNFSVSTGTPEAGIQRLYEGLLGRAADTASLVADDSALRAGATQSTVAGGILSSGEYLAAHGTTTDAQFVASLYQGFLGRAPDAASGALTAALDSGAMTRAQAATDIEISSEAQQHLAPATNGIFFPSPKNGPAINAVYQTALGRNVDVGTETNIGAALNAGTSLLTVIQNVVASAEYQADHIGQSPAALVTSFYENALGRMPDAVGGPADVAMLNAGVPQAQIILGIATSPEAAAHLTAPFPA
jgi:hypothetical protein